MSKHSASRQDRWVIRNWKKALQFEEAMQSARLYHEQLFRKVRDRVSDHFPELTGCTPKRLDGRVKEADWEDGGGCACYFNPKWHRQARSSGSGVWVSNISLDELVTVRANLPTMGIYLDDSNGGGRSLEKLRQRLKTKAKKDRGCRGLTLERFEKGDRQTCLSYNLPEEKLELLKMVVRDDGRPFVSLIAQHVETLARLLQGSDDLLR